MFANIIDVAALASFIIYIENNPQDANKNYRRRKFLHDLAKQLAMSATESRANNPRSCQHFGAKSGIECMLGRTILHQGPVEETTQLRDISGRLKVTGCCYICRSAKLQRKTRKACAVCNKPVCVEHTETIIKCIPCSDL